MVREGGQDTGSRWGGIDGVGGQLVKLDGGRRSMDGEKRRWLPL
jgi:hypothetical protein